MLVKVAPETWSTFVSAMACCLSATWYQYHISHCWHMMAVLNRKCTRRKSDRRVEKWSLISMTSDLILNNLSRIKPGYRGKFRLLGATETCPCVAPVIWCHSGWPHLQILRTHRIRGCKRHCVRWSMILAFTSLVQIHNWSDTGPGKRPYEEFLCGRVICGSPTAGMGKET